VVWSNLPFLLTDTVGFIRKLPTHLIESFKSTLDEIREADILVHVVDFSHPAHDAHIAVVNQILGELKCSEKPTILVYNKIDLVPADENGERFWEGSNNAKNVFISAEKRLNIDGLREALLLEIKKSHMQIFPNWLEPEVFEGM
jgi:GTP-binding protein HflX